LVFFEGVGGGVFLVRRGHSSEHEQQEKKGPLPAKKKERGDPLHGGGGEHPHSSGGSH